MDTNTINGMLQEMERNACTKKVAHMSLRSAEDEAARMRTKTGHLKLIAYRCEFCLLWHVGHAKSPQRLKAEAMLAKMQ